MRHAVMLALVLGLLLSAAASFAATIVVDGSSDPGSRIEFRTFTLPDGTTAELIVIEGDPIVVIIDGVQRIEGTVIEFDPGSRVIRIVGEGSFETEDQRIEGVDIEIDLDAERLGGRDVLIVLDEIDVWGVGALRQPGQVDVQGGLFSPCSRCDQEVWDYGFRARSLRIFPGDRLVAEGVTLLIRDASVLWLPLLVLPLADGDRQPVLRVDRGTATTRARVELRWPYVSGPNALGTFTVRYEADVDPTQPAGLAGRLLGGAVRTSYLGGDLDHRFYTVDGSGRVTVTYRPAYRDPGTDTGRLAPRWSVVARYDTESDLGLPSVAVRLARDDDRVPGRWEYLLTLAGEAEGVRGRFDSQGFVDAANLAELGIDRRIAPSYADRVTPRRTIGRLRLEPASLANVRIGSLRLDALEVDAGAFSDVSNPANRAAAARPLAEGGRLVVRHAQTLAPVALWPGATLDGRNVFEGRYYDTAERLVRWRSDVGLIQAFGGLGTLSVAFVRDVNEGETPFRFDTIPLRNRMDATARLVLTPARWLRLESRTGYTFVDTRRPEVVGWQDVDSRLVLFGDRSWVDLSVANRYGLQTGDPGTLDAALTLQGRRAPAEARLELRHVQDLAPDVGVWRVSDTRTSLSTRLSIDRVLGLEVSTAYRPEGPVDSETGTRDAWEPLDVRLGVGSLAERDARPGARLQILVDLDEGRLTRARLDARAAFGDVEVDAFQRIDLPEGGVTDSRLRVRWFGRVGLDLRGAVLVPPTIFGLEPGTPRARAVSVQLRDLPLVDEGRWELTGRTTFDPALAGGAGGRRNTALDLRVGLVQERLGPVSLSLTGTAQYLLADDALDRSYLQRASVVLGADVGARVGVQGGVSYVASYAQATGTFTRSELVLDRVSVTLRATDQLFVGARVSDVWDFTRTRADRSPWNVQPELFVLWDRCCWAFAGSWNTATGTIRLVLTGPGADTGLEEIIETPLALPRRRSTHEGAP
jgi:hypothetical protein